jgi:hypothetical protein
VGQVTLPPINAGVAKRSEVIAALQAIIDEYNDNIENSNIAAGAAIATSKLADDAGIGGAKLAGTYRVVRKDDTTNTTEATARILTGWGYVAGNNAAFNSKSVTFNSAFVSAPVVIVTNAGSSSGTSWPITGGETSLNIGLNNISNLGFNVRMAKFAIAGFDAGTVLATGANYFFTWVAIGI